MMLAYAARKHMHRRDCPCCLKLDRKDIRAQRRREKAAWRKDAANNE